MIHGEGARATYLNHQPVVDRPDRQVYIAYHAVFGGPAVQKTVPFSEANGAVWSEANTLERLKHPRLVETREAQFDSAPGFVTFVMPFYPCGSIQDGLSGGKTFSIGSAMQIGLDLLEALAFLHDRFNLVHRDVKSGNVFLGGEPARGFLGDLGSIARVDDKVCAALEGFTPIYLDPATRLGGPLTMRSDQYCAGVTIYEMVNNRLVFEGVDMVKAESRLIAGKAAFGPICFAPHVPDRLRRLLRKAMCVDPTKRFNSVTDFATAMRQLNVTDWTPPLAGLEGEWVGSRRGNRCADVSLKIEGVPVMRGTNAGQIRLTALRQTRGGWMRFGAGDRIVGPQDYTAAASFFADVEAKVAQLPAAF